MSEEKPGGWLWKRKPEKPFGPADQKYSKRIKEPVMWWVTLAYWRRRRQMNIWGWICTAHPTVEGAKKLEISRGDYCQGQDRCQGRDQTRVFPKNVGRLVAGTFSSLFSSSLSVLHFSSRVHIQSVSATISELFFSPSFIGWNHRKFACGLSFLSQCLLFHTLPPFPLLVSFFLLNYNKVWLSVSNTLRGSSVSAAYSCET